MKVRRLLVATALVGTLGVISCKHRVYANTKKPSYPDAPPADAGTDSPPVAPAPDAPMAPPVT